ncbi:MAG: enolase C-terminal domain-like protein [Armatimonadota bacterium]|nr:enolase C-terminal domain-like protein [Armatimonadota bacterium]
MDTDIRLVDMEPIFEDEQFRTPLKFGTGVIHAITSLTVRATVENRAGDTAQGLGNILLSDIWGYPSAEMSHEARDEAMREVAVRFCELVMDNARFGHPIDLYLEAKPELSRLKDEVGEELEVATPMPLLGALVCASPADAALHDAFGKVNGICSYDGYGPDFMDHDLSRYLGDEFQGKYVEDYIHDAYKPEMPIFHLVGGMDKLRGEEVTDDDPEDGLPVSLEEWIECDGIFCFKVKLSGTDIEADVERTVEVAEVIDESRAHMGAERFYLSTDSNEQNESPETVVEYAEKLREASPMAYEALLYFEQPTERDLSVHRFDMSEVARYKPVVVDEGVTDVEMLKLAEELGWSGVGLKTCKGHSSSLLYVAYAKEHDLVVTVQDLTNPGLSLIHSAGLAARIDTLMGVEYNSRQYLPWAAPELRERHPHLFTVNRGRIRTESLSETGLGY